MPAATATPIPAAAATPTRIGTALERPFLAGRGAVAGPGAGAAGWLAAGDGETTGDGLAGGPFASLTCSKKLTTLGGNSRGSSLSSGWILRASRNLAFAVCSWLRPRYAMAR